MKNILLILHRIRLILGSKFRSGYPRAWNYIAVSLAVWAMLIALGCAPGATTKVAEQPIPPPDTSFVRATGVSAAAGLVVSAHPLASQVGLEILRQGGNAADAALATLAALNVVEPHASGLGGGGFLFYYDAANDSFHVIDYRERSPARLKVSPYFRADDTLRLVQRSGATSVCTPGAPAGWQALHDRFATRRLPEHYAPAILLADSGYPVSAKQASLFLDYIAELQADSELSHAFLVDGIPPPEGYVLKNPRLAELLRFLSKTRIQNLYYPPYSTEILDELIAGGSTLRQDDLMAYRVKERTPLRGFYHGYEIITLPPPSSGGTALLEILKLVEPYDLKSMGYLSSDYIHTLALATRQALTDGDRWVSDPDHDFVPTEAMLSSEWIDTARTHLIGDSVPARMLPLDSLLAFKNGNTTHLVVVDSTGNMVSLTQSINYFFGSGVLVPELGLLMNNHMADFKYDSVGANAMKPLRRPTSNMAATIVRKDGRPVLVIGSPGGPRIAATLAQVLIDVLDFDIPLAEALNAPRFFPVRQTLAVEARIPESELLELSTRGWKIQPLGGINNYFGGVHAIQFDSTTRTLIGAADPRRDGAAAGY